MLTIGVVDLGRAVYTYNTLSDCAREGARFGIVLVDDGWGTGDFRLAGNGLGTYPSATPYVNTDTIVGRVAKPRGILASDLMKTTIDYFGNPDARLRVPLTVRVEYPFTPLVTYLVGGSTITITASSVMFIQ